MDFLKDFEKKVKAMDGVGGSSEPPRYWYSFGNYVLNFIMSGNFRYGIPQGRVTGLTGPSGSGKSFILGNAIKQAQAAGAYILVIDSEEALDDDFMSKIGVDVDKDYNYKSVRTIPDVQGLVAEFIKGYTKEFGTAEDAPHVLIGIDSLDMLMTETESTNYDSGKFKGDQGQRNKQMKQMLRGFVQDIKGKNISIVVTSQVYQNQDLLNGEGLWIVSQAIRYSMSQIALFTKKKLKDKDGDVFTGIKLVAQGFKTRFTKPFQKVEIEVPYDTGIDVNFGLLEVALAQGVMKKAGSYYHLAGDSENKYYKKDFTPEYYEKILTALEQQDTLILTTDAEEDTNQLDETSTARRKRKAGVDIATLDATDLVDSEDD